MIDGILARRSVRDGFEDRPVERPVIEKIVDCGLAAPSSKNAQPWRLHVVDDRLTLRELAASVEGAADAERYVPIDPATGKPRQWESTVEESGHILGSVPLGIFVENCGAFSGGRGTVAVAADDVRLNAIVGYGLEMAGIGAAIHGMWVAACSLGLSGVFMGDVAIAENTIRQRLHLRGDLIGVLALGYSTVPPFPKAIADDRVVWHND